ncbi:unnamed protein product [Periconia digitata]|uniref:Dipeptidase n=1 Tax=Periconia digitata TaxID=1303443 RepID=A0A9W4XV87_9PLEO|nr:unnamed protein product [Periconia digitata]
MKETMKGSEKTSIISVEAPRRRLSFWNKFFLSTIFFSLLSFLAARTYSLSEFLIYSPYRSCSGTKLSVEQQARKILEDNPLIDGHNDLLIGIRQFYKNRIYGDDFTQKFENGGFMSHVDLPRLDQGLQGGAFWSAFMPCPITSNGTDFSDAQYEPIVHATLDALDLFHRLGERYPKYFTPSSTHNEALEAFSAGRLISPVIIEGLHQIGNSIANLRLFHRLGVRYATLTWNCHNKYADAALESDEHFNARIATPHWHGLSKDGRALVLEMNRLGMIVDLAHVSVDTMRDVLIGSSKTPRPASKGEKEVEGHWEGSIAPPIFSHSSIHAICPHPRNVPDEILHLVRARNSLVMINFSGSFIACEYPPTADPATDLPTTVHENATLAQVVRHIMYVGELIGYDYVGIGTDYDGIEETPVGLEDVSKFPDLVAELLRQGVSEADVIKVVGGNLLRVWKEVDAVKERLGREGVLPLEDVISNPWGII